jgi:hypothetical protein
MRIEWKHLADATVQVTEGLWGGIPGSTPVPAYLFEMHLNSSASETPAGRARISIHNRMAAILTAPKLHSILYIKDFDQHLNPVFGRTRDARTFERYDLQTGTLDYYRKDYLTGVVLTNMTGGEKLAEQSRGVYGALDMMLSAYSIQATNSDATARMPIHVNIEGKVAKFELVMDRRASPIDFNGIETPSLRVRTQPAPTSEVKPKDCEIWSIPFSQAARTLNDEPLLMIARRAPLNCMMPLTVDYEMTLGYIRGSLTSLSATNRVAAAVSEAR